MKITKTKHHSSYFIMLINAKFTIAQNCPYVNIQMSFLPKLCFYGSFAFHVVPPQENRMYSFDLWAIKYNLGIHH